MVLRKAAMRDIPALLDVINSYASQGVMLPRTDFELAESIRDFTVAVSEDRLIGCGALHFYTPQAGGSAFAGGSADRKRPRNRPADR